jgi:hypothetical protein
MRILSWNIVRDGLVLTMHVQIRLSAWRNRMEFVLYPSTTREVSLDYVQQNLLR